MTHRSAIKLLSSLKIHERTFYWLSRKFLIFAQLVTILLVEGHEDAGILCHDTFS